jgi:hypothetical protein
MPTPPGHTMPKSNYNAVYDFELMPYALGDVLTWNVQTAIRCEAGGHERVDAYICMDERRPASIFQSDLVTIDNYGLFISELFGAFGTHPKPGGIFIFRRREDMLARLSALATDDASNSEELASYERAIAANDRDDATIAYFSKYTKSHEHINEFAAKHGRIPLLNASMGCEPDVNGLIANRFHGKHLVVVHMRLRRLDAGYGGDNTYQRDSDFLEWYEFLREAGKKHPNIVFITVGRLQEKPLDILKLPNVISLRTLGLGLGHELTMMLKSDLFIGSSSGFAAMANFSETPYFITKMGPESCKAYQIAYGNERLPFATNKQFLVYEPETRELLMRLLERGLEGNSPRGGIPTQPSDDTIDVRSWEWESAKWLFPGATTCRLFTDENYSDKETAFLVWPNVQRAKAAWRNGNPDAAWTILNRIAISFPRLCEKFPEYLRLKAKLALERNDLETQRSCNAHLDKLAANAKRPGRLHRTLLRYLHWLFPTQRLLKRAWQRKHRIPGKLLHTMRAALRQMTAHKVRRQTS